jgi:NADH pyrophosphatase NudC (nudix superfamily)
MIEIKCNGKQKQIIIESLLNPEGCLFPRKRKTCVFDPHASCKNCFEKKIRWILNEKLTWQKRPRFQEDEQPYLECPRCKHQVDWWSASNFCPNCGTRLMQEGESNDE